MPSNHASCFTTTCKLWSPGSGSIPASPAHWRAQRDWRFSTLEPVSAISEVAYLSFYFRSSCPSFVQVLPIYDCFDNLLYHRICNNSRTFLSLLSFKYYPYTTALIWLHRVPITILSVKDTGFTLQRHNPELLNIKIQVWNCPIQHFLTIMRADSYVEGHFELWSIDIFYLYWVFIPSLPGHF